MEPSLRELSAISFSGQQTIELVGLLSLVGLVLVLFVFTSFYGLLYMWTDNAADKGQSSTGDQSEQEESDVENKYSRWNYSHGMHRSKKAIDFHNVNNMSTSKPLFGSNTGREVVFSTSDDDGIDDEECQLACVVY